LKIFVVPLTGQPRQVLDEVAVRRDFRISPDGKKVAFADADTGRAEVYVAAFPTFEQKRRVSSAGGAHPEWSRDSRELFYLAPDGMLMAAPMRESGDPVALFAIRTGAIGGQFAPLSDGKRFLVLENTGRSDPAQITLVTNWTAAMK
jgi:Tol biopolymer transport system component